MTGAADAIGAEPADRQQAWVGNAIALLRARAWLVALVMGICLVVAVIILRTADYRYTASMRVAPAPSSARESPGIGALGNLASLTGVTIEAAPATPFRLYVEGVHAREVAARLSQDQMLMHQVFAREWNPRTRQWEPPRGAAITLRNALYGLVGAPVPRWTAPNADRLHAWLAANIGVDQSPKTPIVTISLDATDRDFAIRLLGRLHLTVDSWLREKTLDRSRQNIAYLIGRIPSVTQADHRQALFATLSDQQQRQMMARNPAPYAAEPFGAVSASSNPTSPRQLPILVAALFLGLLLGLVLALVIPRKTA